MSTPLFCGLQFAGRSCGLCVCVSMSLQAAGYKMDVIPSYEEVIIMGCREIVVEETCCWSLMSTNWESWILSWHEQVADLWCCWKSGQIREEERTLDEEFTAWSSCKSKNLICKCSSSRISISLVRPPVQQQLKIGKESRFAAAGNSHGHALDALSLWRHHVAVLHNILLLLLAHEALAHPRGSDQFLDPSLGYHPCSSSSSWLLTAATASCQYSPLSPLSLRRDHRRVSASWHSKCTFVAY